MVIMKIRLYKGSSGELRGEFLDGLDGVTQNNSNVNEVQVLLDGFTLTGEPKEELRIAFERTDKSEREDYSLMNKKDDKTYSYNLPYIVTNGSPNAEWIVGLQIVSDYVEGEKYTGYINKQNISNELKFTAKNAVKDINNKYPTVGDIQTLYDAAIVAKEEAILAKEKAEELVENVGDVKEEAQNIAAEKVREQFAAEKGEAGGVATLDSEGKVPTSQLPEGFGGGGEGSGVKELIPVDVEELLKTQNTEMFLSLTSRYIAGEIAIVASMNGSYAIVTAASMPDENTAAWSLISSIWGIGENGTLNSANILVFAIKCENGAIVYGMEEYPLSKYELFEFVVDKGDVEDAEFNKVYVEPSKTPNEYNEWYVGIDSEGALKWELLGTQKVEIDFTDYVKNTDYATKDKGGVVRTDNSFGVSTTYAGNQGFLSTVPASKNDITGKTETYCPITPKLLDHAFKAAATDNKETWTDNDKAKACETIGALKNPNKKGNYYIVGIASSGEQTTFSIANVPANAGVQSIPWYFRDDHAVLDSVPETQGFSLYTCTPKKPAAAANKKYVDTTFGDYVSALKPLPSEEWTFTLSSGGTETKNVCVVTDELKVGGGSRLYKHTIGFSIGRLIVYTPKSYKITMTVDTVASNMPTAEVVSPTIATDAISMWLLDDYGVKHPVFGITWDSEQDFILRMMSDNGVVGNVMVTCGIVGEDDGTYTIEEL